MDKYHRGYRAALMDVARALGAAFGENAEHLGGSLEQEENIKASVHVGLLHSGGHGVSPEAFDEEVQRLKRIRQWELQSLSREDPAGPPAEPRARIGRGL